MELNFKAIYPHVQHTILYYTLPKWQFELKLTIGHWFLDVFGVFGVAYFQTKPVTKWIPAKVETHSLAAKYSEVEVKLRMSITIRNKMGMDENLQSHIQMDENRKGKTLHNIAIHQETIVRQKIYMFIIVLLYPNIQIIIIIMIIITIIIHK